MRSKILTILLVFPLLLFSQKILPTFDGVVSPEEWLGAESFDIKYEVSPGDNVQSPQPTKVYISYSETDLYVGFIAYADMENLRSSVRNRD